MTKKKDKLELSLIVPCLNEEDNLFELYNRLTNVLDDVTSNYEIILVDDGSTDTTPQKIVELSEKNHRVKGLILSRNFGKELALSAGLHHAIGKATVLIDADLQHPPETIPEMISAWKKGARIVTAIRKNRQTDSWLRRWCSRLFYMFFNMLSDVKLNASAGDFRLLDHTVVAVLNNMPERARFSKGLFSWIGYNQEVISYNVEDRFSGTPKFNFLKLFVYSISSLVSFSIAPIRIWFLFGLTLIILSLSYGIFIIFQAMYFGIAQPGYITTILTIILFGGFQMLSLGIFGEYIGRILLEVKARPQFIIMDHIGYQNSEETIRSE